MAAEDDTYSLTIDDAMLEDSGHYMCRAVNDAGSASSESRVRVMTIAQARDQRFEPDSSTLDQAPMAKYRFQTPPDFTVRLKNKSVFDGAHARLACSVTGIPDPQVKWYKDGTEISNDMHYAIRVRFRLFR